MDFTVSLSGLVFMFLFLLKLDSVKVQAILPELRKLKQWELSYLTRSMPIRKCTLDPLIDREKGKAMIRAHVDCK